MLPLGNNSELNNIMNNYQMHQQVNPHWNMETINTLPTFVCNLHQINNYQRIASSHQWSNKPYIASDSGNKLCFRRMTSSSEEDNRGR